METAQPDRKILTAFFLVVLLGGSNSVAIRFSNMELPPFYGAALRFIFAALIFWIIFIFQKKSLPNKKESAVLLINGFVSIGVSFGLLYFGLQKVQANLGTVIIALSPLLTFLLAYLQGIETFRWQVFVGSVIALAGMGIAVNAQLGGEIPLISLIALLGGAVFSAEGNVILKMYSPKSDPITMNCLSLSSGAIFLVIASLAAGESWKLPSHFSTWLALIYLIVGGSALMFYFFVYILTNWTVSAASYTILLFPIIATIMGAWLAGEMVRPFFVVGGLIVIAGVWFGAFSRPKP